MKCVFTLDVGGTTIKCGKFSLEGDLVDYFETRTNVDDNDPVGSLLNQIKEIINNIKANDELEYLGLAVPGPVKDGIVLGCENIKWGQVELKKILENEYPNIKIAVLNDANAATLGEWYYGSGEKVNNLIMVTIGTGIGGGIIVNKELYTGSNGSAGEIGHIRIFPFKGRPCSCGLTGCLEQYASATGIRRTAYGLRRGKHTLLNRYGRISIRDITQACIEQDKIALQVMDKTAYYLAIGLSILAATFNPDVIVIGGGVSKAGSVLLDPTLKHFKELAFYTIKDTKIVLASLYNKAGIYGAYYYALNGE